MERVCFPALSYDDYGSTFPGHIDVDVFVTMNATSDFYQKLYRAKLQEECATFRLLRGSVYLHPIFDTLQVNDYATYAMAAWDPIHKQHHDTQFAADLAQAFRIGAGNRGL